MTRRVVLSGCSGGGKSTLLAALAAQDYRVFPEPGRLIVQQEVQLGGTALPWADAKAFATRIIDMSIAFHAAAVGDIAFYDRSLIDAVTWFEQSGTPLPAVYADVVATYRYDPQVFLTPPWPEVYQTDAERQHDFDDAVAEYNALLESYPAKGYGVTVIPRLPVPDRVDWILAQVQTGEYR
jgi:predicted ATPase